MTIKHILTKEQREAGLITNEMDDHFLIVYDSTRKVIAQDGKPSLYTVGQFTQYATIMEIQKAANDYLAGRKHVQA